jgi:excisionase family DNA binding protein
MNNTEEAVSPMSGLLTVKEALKYLRISRSTLARHTRQGIGPNVVRIGVRTLYRKSDLDDYIQANTNTGEQV